MKITSHLSIDPAEIQYTFIRAPGPGGQNVNKVATGVQLRFNVMQSPSLPEEIRLRLIAFLGNKITLAGEIIIKATRHRTQNRNKDDANERLRAMILHATIPPKKRKKTKPSLSAKKARLDTKKLHGKNKALRAKPTDHS